MSSAPPGAGGRWWSGNVPPEIQAAAASHFAAATRLEAEGRYDEAFAAFAAGNRIKHEALRSAEWVAMHAQGVRHLAGVFTPQFLREQAAKHPAARASAAAPIFILGLPRSGSTLVEQILATHPLVQAMGESPALPQTTRGAYPFEMLGAFDPPAMAADYLGRMRTEGWRGDGRFTDKMLGNYTAIGHIHLMFPRATIVHATRSPADTCVSCYRTLFDNDAGARFAYDLGDLGRHYRAYRSMMDHWRGALMGRLVEVRHEALVADLEGQTRRLLEACGLPWDERCLRFHENPRDAGTASREQVRRPIFTDGVGRWRRYREHLQPLFAALGSYAPDDERVGRD